MGPTTFPHPRLPVLVSLGNREYVMCPKELAEKGSSTRRIVTFGKRKGNCLVHQFSHFSVPR